MAQNTDIGIRLSLSGGAEVQGALGRVEQGISGLGKTIEKIASLGGALYIIPQVMNSTVGAAIKAADAVTVLNNQLKLATGSTQAAAAASQALYDIAQRSRVSFTELGSTFASIARAGDALGLSQQRLLTVTEAISNAVAISGGSAESAKAALIQLSQGLASGVLRGDELNSVMEQTPRLAQALAAGLGITTGELRKMGQEGEISANKVIKALESQAKVLSGEVAGSTLTVGQAMTQLSNATTKLIGSLDEMSGASGSVARGLASVAGAMDTIGKAAKENEGTVKVVFGILAGAAIGATAAKIIEIATSTRALAAAVGLLNVALAANPITLALLGIGAVVGAAAMALPIDQVDLAKRKISGFTAEMNKIEAEIEAQGGQATARQKKRIQELQAGLADLRKTAGDASAPSAAKATPRQLDNQYDKEQAAASASADQSIKEARKQVKDRNAIIEDGYNDSVKLARAYQEKIDALAGDPAAQKEVAKQRDADLISRARETERSLKEFADKDSAMSREAAKSKMDTAIGAEEELQARQEAIAKRKLARLSAEHEAELMTTADFVERKKALDLEANATAQKSVQKEIDLVKSAAIDPKDKIEKLAGYNKELGRLREEEINITEEADNKLLVMASKRKKDQYEADLASIKSQSDDIAKLRESNAALELHNQEIGLNVQQLNSLVLARQDAAIAAQVGVVAEFDLTNATDQTVTAYVLAIDKLKELRKQRELTYQGQLKTESATASQNLAEAGKAASNQIETSLTDALMRGFENGKDFASNFADTVKNMFKTMVLRPIVSAIVQPLAGAVTAGLGLGAASAAAGESGGGAANAVGGVYAASKLSTWLTDFKGATTESISKIGDYFLKSDNTQLYKIGGQISDNAAQISEVVNTASNVLQALNVINLWSQGQRGAAIGAGVGGYFFGPIGGMIGQAIGSKFDYTVEPNGNAIVANVSGAGASAVANRADFVQHGGWFGGGTTNNSDWSNADAGTTGYIDTAIKTVTAANKAYADALGLSADAVLSFSKTIEVNVTGMDAKAAQAAIDAEIAKFASEQASAAFGDAVSSFARSGESTAATVSRLAESLTSVNGTLASFGGALYQVGAAGAAAASQLVDAFGSIQNMQSQIGTAIQNFATPEQQRSLAFGSASNALAGVGLNFSADQLAAGKREDYAAALIQLQKEAAAPNASKDAQQRFATATMVANALNQYIPGFESKVGQTVQQASSGGGGGGGGGGSGQDAANSIAEAWRAITDSIWGEVKRIRGLIEGTGQDAFALAQARFATATAQARAGDQEAAKALPELSQTLLSLAEANSNTLVQLKLIQAQTAGSLMETGSLISAKYGLSIPQFAVGTNYVPQDMFAMIHEGEAIIPKAYNPALGGPQAPDNSGMVAELQALRAQIADLQEAQARTTKASETSADLMTRVTKGGRAMQTEAFS